MTTQEALFACLFICLFDTGFYDLKLKLSYTGKDDLKLLIFLPQLPWKADITLKKN